MPLRRFLPAVIAGSLIWAVVYATVGLAAIAAWFALILASPWAAAGAAVALAVVVLFLEKRRRQAKRHQQAADDGGAPVGREGPVERPQGTDLRCPESSVTLAVPASGAGDARRGDCGLGATAASVVIGWTLRVRPLPGPSRWIPSQTSFAVGDGPNCARRIMVGDEHGPPSFRSAAWAAPVGAAPTVPDRRRLGGGLLHPAANRQGSIPGLLIGLGALTALVAWQYGR